MPQFKASIRYFQNHPEDQSQSYEDVSETFDSKAEADAYITSIREDAMKHILSIQVFKEYVLLGTSSWKLISDSAINYNVNVMH
jgi:proline dehydrogenase